MLKQEPQETGPKSTKGAARPRRHLRCTELAAMYQVDPKTIHNWCEPRALSRGPQREPCPHTRTPGRHLRFDPVLVLEWARRLGYQIPDELVIAAGEPVPAGAPAPSLSPASPAPSVAPRLAA